MKRFAKDTENLIFMIVSPLKTHVPYSDPKTKVTDPSYSLISQAPTALACHYIPTVRH
jgi:hypothetical protein